MLLLVDLDELLREQGGVVSRRQVLDASLSSRQLRAGARRLVRVRRGVYADAAAARQSSPAGRVALQVAAARLVTGVDLVAVGATAALLHGLPLLGPPPARLHLAERKEERPRHHGSGTTLRREEVVLVSGVPAASLARTAVDVARSRGHATGVVAADAVLARGTPRSALEDLVRGRDRWPGVRHARSAIAFADGRAESALESLGRVRFAEQGLPPPQLQVWLGGEDGSLARVDHYWEEHRTIAEADGALKYATPADLFEEKRREDRLRDGGDEFVRYTWDEALLRPELVAARLWRAFERSARRRAA